MESRSSLVIRQSAGAGGTQVFSGWCTPVTVTVTNFASMSATVASNTAVTGHGLPLAAWHIGVPQHRNSRRQTTVSRAAVPSLRREPCRCSASSPAAFSVLRSLSRRSFLWPPPRERSTTRHSGGWTVSAPCSPSSTSAVLRFHGTRMKSGSSCQNASASTSRTR